MYGMIICDTVLRDIVVVVAFFIASIKCMRMLLLQMCVCVCVCVCGP